MESLSYAPVMRRLYHGALCERDLHIASGTLSVRIPDDVHCLHVLAIKRKIFYLCDHDILLRLPAFRHTANGREIPSTVLRRVFIGMGNIATFFHRNALRGLCVCVPCNLSQAKLASSYPCGTARLGRARDPRHAPCVGFDISAVRLGGHKYDAASSYSTRRAHTFAWGVILPAFDDRTVTSILVWYGKPQRTLQALRALECRFASFA